MMQVGEHVEERRGGQGVRHPNQPDPARWRGEPKVTVGELHGAQNRRDDADGHAHGLPSGTQSLRQSGQEQEIHADAEGLSRKPPIMNEAPLNDEECQRGQGNRHEGTDGEDRRHACDERVWSFFEQQGGRDGRTTRAFSIRLLRRQTLELESKGVAPWNQGDFLAKVAIPHGFDEKHDGAACSLHRERWKPIGLVPVLRGFSFTVFTSQDRLRWWALKIEDGGQGLRDDGEERLRIALVKVERSRCGVARPLEPKHRLRFGCG